MHHILFEYKRAKHSIVRIDNQIINDFSIETRACNVYIRETMFTKDAFINDINHLARTRHHLHHNFIHDKNLQSNLTTMKHHHMKSPNFLVITQLGY
jgi:hypothetical protein